MGAFSHARLMGPLKYGEWYIEKTLISCLPVDFCSTLLLVAKTG
jgi:hypothetical protein